MSIGPFSFTKNWNSGSDFPTVEPSEITARADLQELHDQALAMINTIATAHNTLETAHNTDMPEALTDAEIDAICV